MNQVEHDVALAIGSRPDCRIFRNTTGEGWQGEVVTRSEGRVLLRGARYVRFGLAVGSADYVGWRTLLVTPDMVGETIAQFLAAECKDGLGRLSKEQTAFLAAVSAAGGLAGVVRSAADAVQLVEGRRTVPGYPDSTSKKASHK